MPRAIGANCRVHTIPETVYGTPPGGNWRRMPFLSIDLGAEQPLLDNDIIGAGNTRDPAAPFLDTVTVRGQAVVPVDLVSTGHWLRLLLGPPTTTGTSPNFVHSFASGAAALPSNKHRDRLSRRAELRCLRRGARGRAGTRLSPTGPTTATLGLMGQGSTRSASSSAGTPTSHALTLLNKAQGSISRNGTPLAQITGARLTFDNGMEMVRTIRATGTNIAAARGARVTTGTLARSPTRRRSGGSHRVR
jgi:hypothetical protein